MTAKAIKIFMGLIAITVTLSSCLTIMPKYTTVEQILELKEGMTPAEVQQRLGILPYDVFHNQFGNTAIHHYKYKYLERKVGASLLNKREGLTSGPERFTKSSELYVHFDEDKLSFLVTEEGKGNSKRLILFENTIKVMNENETDFINPPASSKSYRK